jgi:anti-anti-sigma factor
MCPAGIHSVILDVGVRRHGAHYVLSLAGELDLSSAPLLEAQVAELEGLGSCVVDLHRLDFIDCAGLRALVNLSQELTARGGRLVVTRPKGLVAKVLDVAGPADWQWASRAGGRCFSWSSQRPDAGGQERD